MRQLLIKIIILSVSILLSFFAFAHAQDRDGQISSEQLRDMARTTAVPDQSAVETQGTPFFNNDFMNGTITFKNGQTTNVMPLRYNAYEGNLQFQNRNDIFAVDSNTIDEFELHGPDGVIQFKKGYDARRLSEDDFVAVMTDGEAKFMVKHTVNYREDISGYGQATRVEEYSQSQNFYVKFGDNDVDRIRSLNERRVMRTFPSHEDELEEYAQENRIDFSSITDVTRLFRYYNSLVNSGS